MTLSPTHSRPAECGSRQVIQARPDHSNRVVSPSRGLPLNLQQVALAQIDLFAMRFNNSGHSSGCAQSVMVGSGSIHLPTINHIGQSGGGVAGLPMQENHSDCSGVAQHALVLGSSGHVQSNPTEPAQSAQPVDSHSIRSLTEI